MRIRLCAAMLIAIGTLALSAATRSEQPATPHKESTDIELFSADKIKWKEGPPSLPQGAMIAVLEGDPTKEGPFVFRVKLPDAYRVPPHTHPKIERVTVISGTFNIGMGDTFDEKATKVMAAGAYGYWPAGMKHFVWAKGETVLQFHGTGPWSIKYVNPDDDPRKNKEKNDDLKSGPQAGDNLPGPFHSLVTHSEEPSLVGKKVDFFEMYANDPAVLIFAREMTKPLIRLVKKLDAEVAKRKPAKLRAIVVILSDEDAVEQNLKDYGEKQGIKNVHLAIMEPDGPARYKLSKEADVTVVMYNRLKVEANYAFEKGKLNKKGVEKILADVPKIISSR